MKICARCHQSLPFADFHKASLASGQEFHAYCKPCLKDYRKEWRVKSPNAKVGERDRARRERARLREQVLAAYGGRCTCCGESEPDFLSVEHLNGDGAEHRRAVGKVSTNVYRDLRKRGFPQEGYTLLCFNCNLSKGFYGSCPHTR